MMARRGMLGLLAGGAALALSGCGSRETFRYKMTVEVGTPRGVKSGYAVREIVVRTPPPIPMLGEDRGGVSVRGEAVAVDIAPGKTLFALLTGADGEFDFGGRDVLFMFKELTADKREAVIELWPEKPTTQRPIIAEPTPMLVMFSDLTDPTSVKRIEPTNLAASFGTGVRLKRITIERTRDNVTEEIEKRLDWLNHLERYRKDPNNPFTNTLPSEIGGLQRGVAK